MSKLASILLIFTLLLSSCGRHSNRLTPDSLKNMTYTLDSFEGMAVTLKDGKFGGQVEGQEGSEFDVGMLDQRAIGQINGNDAAAVVLYSNSGGSGTFLDLALVLDLNDKPANVATANLGDRVKVNGISIEKDTIRVDMTVHGPEDPMCCPSLNVKRSFVLQGSALIEPSIGKNPLPEDPD